MSKCLVGLAASLLCFLFSSAVVGQVVYDGNNNLPLWGGFAGSDHDTISLQNANLHLHIPLASWKQRAGTPISLYFAYDAPAYVRKTTETTLNGHRYYTTSINGPGAHWGLYSNVGFWSVSSPIGTIYCPGLGSNVNLYNEWVVGDPEGTLHQLDLSVNTCTGPATPQGTFSTTDGSGIIVNLGSNPPLLTLKDGTQITLTKSDDYVYLSKTTQEDTNGNFMALGNDTFERNLVTTTQGSGYWLYSTKDSNGTPQTYRLDYANIAFATANFCGNLNNPPYWACAEENGTIQLPTKLTLPDGQTYQFLWNTNTPGELQSLTLATGGSLSYTYGSGCRQEPITPQYNSITVPYDCSAGVSSRTVTVNGSSSTWTYSGNTTVTDPNGNDATHTFGFVDVNGILSAGSVETDVYHYQGPASGNKLLKHIHTDYTGEENHCSPICLLINVRPIRVTTTLDNGLVTKTETDYETFTLNKQTYTRLNPTETREYDYGSGAPGPLLKRTDYTYLHNNNSAYANLNIVDRPASVTVYDGSGNKVSQTTYEYDVYSHPGLPSMAVSGAVQHDSARGTNYTTRGNVTGISRWLNTTGASLTTYNQYDDAGNLIATKDPNGNVTTFDYTDSWNNATCAPSGQGKAYVTTITNALSQVTKKTYNSCTGTLASSKDPNDINASRSGTTFSYDLMGRVTQVSYPDGGSTSSCYTDVGGSLCPHSGPPYQVVTSKVASPDPNIVSTTVYDGLGRTVQTQVDSASPVIYTDTSYDGLGRVQTVSNPHFSTSSPTDGSTTSIFDALGRTCVVVPPNGTAVPGNTCPATQPANDSFTSYTGNCATVTDQAGHSRKSCTDALGRLTQVYEDPSGLNYLTSYTYDALDNLTGVVQSGLGPRTFVYDSLSRLTSATNPESGTITYKYDANSNLISKTAPAPNQTGTATVTTTYSYDALNRLIQKNYSDTSPVYANGTPTVQYGYDLASVTMANKYTLANTVGRLSWSAPIDQNFFPIAMDAFSYDAFGRVKQFWQETPANRRVKDQVICYDYDLAGNPVDFFVAANQATPQGVIEQMTYDGAGRLATFFENVTSNPPASSTMISGVAYNPLGQKTSAIFSNGLSQSWLYNNRGLVTNMAVGTGCSAGTCTTTKYGYSLAYAPNGNVTSASDSVNNNWNYSYDTLNRLVCANLVSNGTCPTTGTPTYSYTYDRFGNRLRQSGPIPFNATFTGGNNRIDGYCYDAAGNLLDPGPCPTGSNPVHAFKYDAENRLVTSSLLNTNYLYDADGRRVEKATGGTLADYVYYQDGNILSIWITGSPSFDEFYANGWHFLSEYVNAAHNAETHYFDHADWLDTERARTDMTGSVAETCSSLPFGDGMNCTGPTDVSPLHFTGKERDSESGLDNFGARYDSSSLGRFMSPDPPSLVGLPVDSQDPQSWNAYSYVRNNPLNLTDPDGTVFCRPANDAEKGQGISQVCDVTDTQYVNARDAERAAYNQAGYKHYDCSCDTDADRAAYQRYRSGATTDVTSDYFFTFPALFSGVRGLYSLGKFAVNGIADLFIGEAEEEGGVAIGKLADLEKPGALKPGERTLDLPNQGSPKANWAQNSGKLREAMSEGKPIRDVSAGKPGSESGFLRAERNLLRDRGWELKGDTWYPPNK